MRMSIACTLLSRLRGLSRSSSEGRVLLLVPCNDIQTFTMRRAIDVAFVSQDGIVLESHRGVGPRKRLRNRRAAATLERFSRDGPWYEPGDCVSLMLPPKSLCCQPGSDMRERDLERADSGLGPEHPFDLEPRERERRSSQHEDMSRVR